MNDLLKESPKYLRAVAPKNQDDPRVDRTGGYRKAGVIRGVSVITKGEALGHDLWIDEQMLEEVADGINLRNKGSKSRFTHPSLSGDGLGRFVGRVMDAELKGDRVIADQHFSEAAHKSPEGNLAGYLMDLAESDPEAYGLSIVFSNDIEAMEAFTAENSIDGVFTSPDPMNTRNLPHARVAEMRAVDAVDEPAANPDGLFHREQEIAQEAEAMASFALGISEEKPETVSFGVDPERMRQFVGRFLATNNLTIKGEEMAEEIKEEETTATEELSNAAEVSVDDNDIAQAGEQAEASELSESKEPEDVTETVFEGQKFLDEFGDKGGVWFAQGKSFEECVKLNVESLKKENEELRNKISALTQGEQDPIDFSSEVKEELNKKPGGLINKIKMPGVN